MFNYLGSAMPIKKDRFLEFLKANLKLCNKNINNNDLSSSEFFFFCKLKGILLKHHELVISSKHALEKHTTAMHNIKISTKNLIGAITKLWKHKETNCFIKFSLQKN